MKRSFCFLLLPILVTSAGCPTTDNNVGGLGNDSAVAGGSGQVARDAQAQPADALTGTETGGAAIGSPCDLPAGAQGVFNNQALECPSRLCLKPEDQVGGVSTGPLCSSQCSIDSDCVGQARDPNDPTDKRCAGGYTCAVLFVVGPLNCEKLCVCKDFLAGPPSTPLTCSSSGGTGGTGGTTTTGGSTGATGGTIAADGGGGSDGGGGIPENHRINHATCGLSTQSTSPCVAYGTSGTEFSNCSASSDCQSGTNGRCLPVAQVDGNACNCAYDNCFSDGDCSAVGPCICGNSGVGNRCLMGDCQVDADCGPQGYCSPSRGLNAIVQEMSSTSGWDGFYCHRNGDVCINDADCPQPQGWWGDYCAYDTTISAWACMRYNIE